MNPDYPLRFQPIFRRYLWGGRRLETVLGKPLPAGDDYAESWEIVDHGDDQSEVVAGPLNGQTLGRLVQQYGPALLGARFTQPQFPLLFKFLDAQRDLSVQVHPNDEQAAQLTPPDRGKTEAWVVLHKEPNSVIYAGLKAGVGREALARHIGAGTTAECLHSFEPQIGDCLLIPAGTIHALGAGLVIAEIQQASDTTFRVFDWNRVGADGNPRPLHIQQALDVIDFSSGPAVPQSPQPAPVNGVERLAECDKFILDRWRFDSSQSIGGDGRFHIIVVLEGSVSVERDADDAPLRRGQTILLPAVAGSVLLTPDRPTAMLDIYLPDSPRS